MRRPSLLAGVTMAAILGVSLTTVSMPARAGEPSAGPGPAAEAPVVHRAQHRRLPLGLPL